MQSIKHQTFSTSIGNNGKSIIEFVLFNKNIDKQKLQINMKIYSHALENDYYLIETYIKLIKNNIQNSHNIKQNNDNKKDKFF